MMAVLAALPLTVVAQEMPRFDVEGHCEEVAEFGGSSHQIYNGCIQMEQGAYNSLKSRWANVSGRIRNHCQEVAEFSGGSYQILQGCVQMEEDAAGNRQSFSFD
ncbi:hypothetical protein CK498_12280 [Halomonas salipaludis]|uniref:Uncharacterized protein n=1 Tax=Halomonas salipaludis TaxID=2032625 RepID=A0A2A2EX58_9GAMM|nr:hypothetical protein CK498_12280 [Halomonas salipaludis]